MTVIIKIGEDFGDWINGDVYIPKLSEILKLIDRPNFPSLSELLLALSE